MKKLIVTALLAAFTGLLVLSCASGPLNAAKLNKNEIILVGKIVCDPPLSFVKPGAKPETASRDLDFGMYLQPRDAGDTKSLRSFVRNYNAQYANRWASQDQFFVVKSKRAGVVDLFGFHLKLYTVLDANLPAFYSVEVPDGARALYLGTFRYKLNEYLEVTKLSIDDEYDEAAAAIAKDFPSWELVRADLKPINPDEL